MEREELTGWLRLVSTPGIGDVTARRLLAAFGLPADVLAQPAARLREVATAAQVQALGRMPEALPALVERTLGWLAQEEAGGVVHRLVTLGDIGYPAALLEMADPPLMLHLIGPATLDLTQLGRSVAMVGSRNPTPQGEDNARAFARAFGERGIAVISGLALGVDGAAHQGALDADADATGARAGDVPPGWPVTVAVVGTGLDRVYPARHRDLAHRIARRGLIVSEFPLGTPPLHPNFPSSWMRLSTSSTLSVGATQLDRLGSPGTEPAPGPGAAAPAARFFRKSKPGTNWLKSKAGVASLMGISPSELSRQLTPGAVAARGAFLHRRGR